MAGAYVGTLRLINRDVRLYLLGSALIGFTVFGGITSVLGSLYLLRLGYGPDFIGLVNAAGELGFAVFGLPAAVLGRRWDSRRMLIGGLAIGTIGCILLPVAELLPGGWRSGWILTTGLCSSFGFALYFVGGSPFLMLRTNRQERNHVFALQSALWPLAGFAGSVVGGLLPRYVATTLQVSLDGPAPFRYPLLLSAAILSATVPVLLYTRHIDEQRADQPVSPAAPHPVHAARPTGVVALVTIATVLMVAGEGAGRFFFNVYLDDGLHVPIAQIGLLSGVAQLVAVPAALVTPLLAGRWGNRRTTTLASLGMALSLIPMALIPHWGGVGFGFMMLITMASIRRPAMLVYAMEIVDPIWRSMMSGANTMAVGLSWFVAALAGGYIIVALGYRSLFLLGAALTAAGALLFWAYFRMSRADFVPLPPGED